MAGKPVGVPGRLALKKRYDKIASIEPFYTGGGLSLSLDGSIMACTCGGEVKLLKTETGAVMHTLEADSDSVTALALSPNGQELITAGRDFMIKTWDVATGKKIRGWKASQGNCYVQRLAYDETSTLVAGGCSDGVVRVWDSGRGYATHSLRGHSAIITSVLFGAAPRTDPNKLLLFTGAEDGEVRVWALATKSCKAVLKSHDSAVTSIDVHAATKSLVTGGRDRVVCVWDLKAMKIASSVPIYDTIEGMVVVSSAAPKAASSASPKKKGKKGAKAGGGVVDGSNAGEDGAAAALTSADIEFVTAGGKGQLKRWRVGGGQCLVTEEQVASGGAYDGLWYNESSGSLLASTIDQTLLFVDPNDLTVSKQMVGHNDDVIDAAFCTSEDIAVCTNTDQLRIFNTESRACRLLHGHTDIILCVDCSAQDGIIVTSSKDRTVRVWSLEGACLGLAEGHVESVGAVCIAHRNRQIAVSGSKDLTVKVWDLKACSKPGREPGAPVPVLKTWRAHEKDINSVCVSPNDGVIATGSADRTVKLWDASTGAPMGICKGHKRGVWCVAFSPVDKVVASSSADATIKLWSLTDASCLKTFEGHEGSVLKVAFVCSGMQLLSSGSDTLVKLWTIKSTECVGTFEHHEDKVWALAVSPGDDTLVVTGGSDGVLTLWDDKTHEIGEEAFQESQERIELEQKMMNAMRKKDWKQVALLAFELKQPHRLLHVTNEIMLSGQEDMLDEIVSGLTKDQLAACIGYVRDWNTTTRNAYAAQVMLAAIFRANSIAKLFSLPDIKAVVDALLPFTERHHNRVEDSIQKTYYIDYVLHAASAVGVGEGDEDEPWMDEVGEGEEEEEEEEAAEGVKMHGGDDLEDFEWVVGGDDEDDEGEGEGEGDGIDDGDEADGADEDEEGMQVDAGDVPGWGDWADGDFEVDGDGANAGGGVGVDDDDVDDNGDGDGDGDDDDDDVLDLMSMSEGWKGTPGKGAKSKGTPGSAKAAESTPSGGKKIKGTPKSSGKKKKSVVDDDDDDDDDQGFGAGGVEADEHEEVGKDMPRSSKKTPKSSKKNAGEGTPSGGKKAKGTPAKPGRSGEESDSQDGMTTPRASSTKAAKKGAVTTGKKKRNDAGGDAEVDVKRRKSLGDVKPAKSKGGTPPVAKRLRNRG